MREILFRGFAPNENGKEIIWVNGKEVKGYWKFGFYWYNELGNDFIKVSRDINKDFINPIDFEIINETASQFTGLLDKHGNKIFEGDILIDNKKQKGTVFYRGYGFAVNWKMEDGSYETDTCFVGEIIGNRWEKELV